MANFSPSITAAIPSSFTSAPTVKTAFTGAARESLKPTALKFGDSGNHPGDAARGGFFLGGFIVCALLAAVANAIGGGTEESSKSCEVLKAEQVANTENKPSEIKISGLGPDQVLLQDSERNLKICPANSPQQP